MIPKYSEISEELSIYEKTKVIPVLENGMKSKIGKDMAVTNQKIVTGLDHVGIKTSQPRIRKMLHILRVSDRVKRLIAHGLGYHVSDDIQEMNEYIESLEERVRQNQELITAIKRQRDEFINAKQLTIANNYE